MIQSLHLRLLGSVEVEWAGTRIQPASFQSRKDLALLCYLASEKQPKTRPFLASLFWNDKTERQGLNNLNRVLSQLRKLLPDCLVSDSQHVAFDPQIPYWLDIDTFLDLEAKQTVDSLAAAVSLYRDEFMAGFVLDCGFEFETWLIAQREFWLQKAAACLRRLTDHHTIHNEDAVQGLAFATRLLQLQPWHEAAHRKIMRILARQGRYSAALAQYHVCQKVLAQELGVEPAKETLLLYDKIRHARQTFPVQLPAPLTPLVGRQQIVAHLSELLAQPEYRLVTITGPAGIGKSRVAIAVAHTQQTLFLNGVSYLALGSLSGAEQLPRALAAKLNVEITSSVKLESRILETLYDKEILLVLDNFDPCATEEGARLLVAILMAAPTVKILITSRQRLSIPGEQVIDLPPLSFPHRDPAPLQPELYTAVQLFLQAAQATLPTFSPDETDMTAIYVICRELSGFPLAIERAATWLAAMSCTQIAAAIAPSHTQTKSLISNAVRDRQDVDAVLNEAWQQLSIQQQDVLCQLALFQGTFTLEAAVAVTQVPAALVSALVKKSLLRWSASTERYALYSPVKRFALGQLTANPLRHQAATHRFVEYYATLLQQHLQVASDTASQSWNVFEDMDNIYSSWTLSVENRQFDKLLQILNDLCLYFEEVGRFADAVRALGRLHDLLDNHSLDFSAHTSELAGQIFAHRASILRRLEQMDH